MSRVPRSWPRRKAIKLATTEKPGAVHIGLTEDIAASTVNAVPLSAVSVRRPVTEACIGVDMIEYPPSSWNPGKDKDIVHIDFIPAEVDAHYQPSIEVVGDLAHALWMMNERLQSDTHTAVVR